MTAPRRTTHTVIVPLNVMARTLSALILNDCVFTCEPSPTRGVWHVGVLPEGVAVVNRCVAATVDVGSLGEWRDLEKRATAEES